jgi:hypothetical protein
MRTAFWNPYFIDAPENADATPILQKIALGCYGIAREECALLRFQ